ncbi:chemotaxis-specific protein-glutamate methyltransferase CheB [Sphingomicrobium marinum]|uniref:chemotaxis-specific protein-glutamate methyltransferase CheB n=1 Tax=Sphingomicrobium marinum TaxID=1227950 RepID=UPI00223FEFF7|nr:chemotaxis-specific protein-glutamate methyltransferase CheB [Sphingomicrobium marinum]
MAGALASNHIRRPSAQERVRLMIVDDSMVARAVLSRIVSNDPRFEIVAVAGTAEDAVTALQYTRVDIILLDLEMPGAGGLKHLPKIIEVARGAQVLIVSSLADEGAEVTVQALALGAADTLPKPGTGKFRGRFSEVLLGKLGELASGTVAFAASREQQVLPLPDTPAPGLRLMPDAPLELLAIGASTGGIHALSMFFHSLPPKIGVPILVTQHLPAAFMSVFARQLGSAALRPCWVAENGMKLEADQVYVAPGEKHLSVERREDGAYARLSSQPARSGCCPSVDPMFDSAAREFGEGAIGVVLTGMGRDGTDGAAKLVACGGAVIAQDENSSAVWGMPRAVADAGLIAASGTPGELADLVANRLERD